MVYISVSRIKINNKLKIFILNEDENVTNITKSIVYK